MELCNLRPFQNLWDQVHDFTPSGSNGEKHWSILHEKVSLECSAENEKFFAAEDQRCVPWTTAAAAAAAGCENQSVIACASEDAAMEIIGRLSTSGHPFVATRHMDMTEDQRKVLVPSMPRGQSISDVVLLLVAASASSCGALLQGGDRPTPGVVCIRDGEEACKALLELS